ncbi:MAG: hypothetical protein LBV27_08150 [Oscillospiraceae bacterium]|jgi:hypothetical protein|nr:hypothetical protein [Oscillospiraceae bacterium]
MLKTIRRAGALILTLLALCLVSCKDGDASSGLSAAQSGASSGAQSVEALPASPASGMSEAEIIDLVKTLTKKGDEVFWWYMDEGMGLDVDTQGSVTDVIRPVGRFKTIDALKAATEEVFSAHFCNKILYPVGFNENQGENIKFREIDGVLHINLNNGGMGWIDELTDKITVKEESVNRITVTIISNQLNFETSGTEEVPYDFDLILEDGVWKLDNWFDYGTEVIPSLAESDDTVENADAKPMLEKYASSFDQYMVSTPKNNVITAYIYTDGGAAYDIVETPVPDYMLTVHDYLAPVADAFGALEIDRIVWDEETGQICVNFSSRSFMDGIGDDAKKNDILSSITRTIMENHAGECAGVYFEMDMKPYAPYETPVA